MFNAESSITQAVRVYL